MSRINRILACVAIAVPALSAQAYPEILKSMERHSGNCHKFPTADARSLCEQKYKEGDKAFDKHSQEEDAKYKSSQPQFKKPASDKPSGLCFTRKATGEVVCPN